MSFANWSYPTDIRFGEGRIKELRLICESYGIMRPLIVTDRTLLNLPHTQEILASIRSHFSTKIFSDVDSNPTEKNLDAGVDIFKSGSHDGVIAIGGGSCLDIGKLIAFMVSQIRSVWDFEDIDDWWTRAESRNIYPIIAIPTTAGTGSEVGRASVLTNSTSREKKIIFHPKILPSVVICDPNLTLSMPQNITAGTGLDALAHCVEAYCSPSFHPMSHGIALEGIKLIKENLVKVYMDGSDLNARSSMMCAALMGAVAFQKGLGAVHALSHPIGAIYNTHHGLTNAVLLPHVLRANRKAIDDSISTLSYYLEIKNGFDGFLNFIDYLNATLNVPKGLKELGVLKGDFDQIIDGALKDPSKSCNPIELNIQNLRTILNTAL